MALLECQRQCMISLFFTVATLLFLSTNEAATYDKSPSMSETFEQWMMKYGRVYKDAGEKQKRFEIFKDNVEFVESFNAAAAGVKVKLYTLSVNDFADRTDEEIKAYKGYRGSHKPSSKKESSSKFQSPTDIPDALDWRQRGAVTSVKDQGQCESSWAFASVASIEGAHQIANGELYTLSEQMLVDCDFLAQGCDGGSIEGAYTYVVPLNHGLPTESTYPYQGVKQTCDPVKAGQVTVTVDGFKRIPADTETELLNAVANQPVSVGIDASGREFVLYSGGVFTGEHCGTDLNHAVTVVGYGSTNDGTKYWVLKNSWGTDWGEDGYMRLERGVNGDQGLCGITLEAYFPVA